LQLRQILWKIKIFNVLLSHPRRKVTHLSIVSVIGEQKFRPDEENLSVQGEHSAIEAQVPVQDWKTDVQDYIVASLIS